MMVSEKDLLKENLLALEKADEWFCRSNDICKDIKNFDDLSPDQLEMLESLTARYARLVDILFSKVFRSIARVEMVKVNSLLDVLLFLNKNGLFESLENVKLLKEIRNDIVHEYFVENIIQLFENVKESSDELIKLVEKTREYTYKLIKKIE